MRACVQLCVYLYARPVTKTKIAKLINLMALCEYHMLGVHMCLIIDVEIL